MEFAFKSDVDRRLFALLYCLWAFIIATALLSWIPGGLVSFVPALAPTFVAATLIAISARFASMGWVLAIACVTLAVETGAVALVFSTDRDGYSMLYLLPAAAGFLLALVSYLLASWGRLSL